MSGTTSQAGVADAEAARAKRQDVADAATIAALDAERGPTVDLTPELHDPHKYDATALGDRSNGGAESIADFVTGARACDAVVPSDINILPKANLQKAFRIVATCVGNPTINQNQLKEFLKQWVVNKAKGIEAVLELTKGHVGIVNAQIKRHSYDLEIAHQRDLGILTDKTEARLQKQQAQVSDDDYKQLDKAFVDALNAIDTMTMVESLGESVTGLNQSLRDSEQKIETMFTEVGEQRLTRNQRQNFYLGDYPDWTEFCTEIQKYDPNTLIGNDLVRKWLTGNKALKEKAPNYGGNGKAVWAEMLRRAGLPHEPFDTMSKSSKRKKEICKWSPDHINLHCSMGDRKRKDMLHEPVNNPFNFGIIYMLTQSKGPMMQGAESMDKIAYWGQNICHKVNAAARHYIQELQGAARDVMQRRMANGENALQPFQAEHSTTKVEKTFLVGCAGPALRAARKAKIDKRKPLAGQQKLGAAFTSGAGSSRAAADDSDTPETEEAGSSGEASASEEEKAPDGAHTPPGSPSHPAGESAKEAGSSGEPSASAESEKEEAPAGEPAAKKAKTGQTSNAQIGMSTCKVCKCEVEPGKKRATQVCRRHDKSSKCKNGCFNEAETRKDSKKLGKLALVRKNQSSGGRVGWCRRCDHLNADGDERKKAENAELSKKIAQECRNPS